MDCLFVLGFQGGYVDRRRQDGGGTSPKMHRDQQQQRGNHESRGHYNQRDRDNQRENDHNRDHNRDNQRERHTRERGNNRDNRDREKDGQNLRELPPRFRKQMNTSPQGQNNPQQEKVIVRKYIALIVNDCT